MDTTSLILILLIAIFILLLFVVFRFFKQKSGGTDNLLIQQQLQDLSKTLNERMDKSSAAVQESVHKQLTSSQKLIQDITKEITEVKETNKQVFSITESLKNLEKVLKSQKQRGNLGEAGLKMALENFLAPSMYEMQYSFKNGESVDAIIKAPEGIICIDAKFSLEHYERLINEEDESKKAEHEKNFKNDLKKRIDETAKYIRPEEGTLPFALMYIPAEGIYYDLLVNPVGTGVNSRNLIDYAFKEKKVVVVSPTTLVAYLHTILQGFRAFKLEKSAEMIGVRVEQLSRHIKKYEEYHNKLGKTLQTSVNHYNHSGKELEKIEKDVLRITGSETGLDVEMISEKTDE